MGVRNSGLELERRIGRSSLTVLRPIALVPRLVRSAAASAESRFRRANRCRFWRAAATTWCRAIASCGWHRLWYDVIGPNTRRVLEGGQNAP